MEELPVSVDYESISAKFSDYDIDLVSALDMSALVREQHPIRLSCFRRAALPEQLFRKVALLFEADLMQ